MSKERPTPETDAFEKEWPDNRRHNWPCTFEGEAFAKLRSMERSREKARERVVTPHPDFKACGDACQMKPVETVLGSVLRVVKERDDQAKRIEAALTLLRACRRRSDGMNAEAYFDLQQAINELEPPG